MGSITLLYLVITAGTIYVLLSIAYYVVSVFVVYFKIVQTESGKNKLVAAYAEDDPEMAEKATNADCRALEDCQYGRFI
jgi:hypothetical protein